MKFALVNGERREAQPKLVGECGLCGSEMIAKCGDVYAHHWAHKSRRKCDPWWENETEWHRAWKNRFPLDWQEVVCRAEDGEKHVADVQTEDGWFIEFQHSRIKLEERDSREEFFEKLIWVVDGKLRPTYEQQFQQALDNVQAPITQLPSLGRFRQLGGRLLDQWANRMVHVLLDFGADGPLWWLLPLQDIHGHWITRIRREDFIQALGPVGQREDKDFGAVADSYKAMLKDFETMERRAANARSRLIDPLAIPRRPRRGRQ
jgi:hypothetical protein